MKAFVTGATGFAGRNLCRTLLDGGHEVVGLVRPGGAGAELAQRGVQIVNGDVREPAGLARAMREADALFHLAAAFRDASLSDAQFVAVNVDGTANVIRAAATAEVGRIVHCSTIGVVGDTGRQPADETRPISEAADSYNRSKIAGEGVARRLFDELGVDGVIARPAAGYGPGELRYLKLFKGVLRRRFMMLGAGQTLYNLGYIDDLCAGLLLCATCPDAAGEIFHLGGPENVTLNELVKEVARAVGAAREDVPHLPVWPVLGTAFVVEAMCKPLGVKPPLHRRRVEFFTVNRAVDTTKARRVLGYEPRMPLAEGLRLTAAWYRQEGLL